MKISKDKDRTDKDKAKAAIDTMKVIAQLQLIIDSINSGNAYSVLTNFCSKSGEQIVFSNSKGVGAGAFARFIISCREQSKELAQDFIDSGVFEISEAQDKKTHFKKECGLDQSVK